MTRISNIKYPSGQKPKGKQISNKPIRKNGLEIGNWKLEIGNSEGGFTLVELLAVIVVLVAIGSIIAAILFSSLRGSTKTNAIINVKQNGGFAVSQMGKMIRDARSLEAPRPCTVISPTPIPTVTQVTIKNFDGGQTTFICNDITGGGPPTIASQSGTDTPISLLDTSTVVLSSCYFTCTQNSLSDFPSISIFFSLQSKGGSLVEQLAAPAAIPFETSVSLRNLR